MKELNALLSEASRVYYAEDREIMSNLEYDRLYDELVSLEEETGVILSGSPTQRVGYEAVDALPKERHAAPMLSLGKTKDREELREWLGDRKGVLSWKLDGLTVVLTYEGGILAKAVTRGNGEIGEVITPNARAFENLPMKIPFTGTLVLRGEAVISYPDFEAINAALPEEGAAYKNPRNLCSGSVRQLDSAITAKRHVRFIAFHLVSAEGTPEELEAYEQIRDSAYERLEYLRKLGFEAVEHYYVTRDSILDRIEYFAQRIRDYEIPSDGLVLTYEEVSYGMSLGTTAKAPRHSIAFKWADETAETVLRDVEWSASRTGLINPVAIFDPVELEGTTVSRASVHNVSIVRELGLGLGDHLMVYKANMIIPQIAENLTRSGSLEIPAVCPVCGGRTEIRSQNEAQSLYCTNPECPAKQIKSFTQFVSRDAMNVDGLSEATLEKFIDCGFIKDFADLYHLDRYREEIIRMEGFGEKSYENLWKSIRTSQKTTLPRLIYALGIENVGVAGAKLICKALDYDVERLRHADAAALAAIEGVGDVISGSLMAAFADPKKSALLDRLLGELELEKPETASGDGPDLTGKTFVITGSLVHYPNRDALKAEIESRGGKVAGSVSAKTTALINNDVTSTSNKNRTARDLGIPILSEEDFQKAYLGFV
ncbi:MAG: NAD-dependent DNA ligase LigA [Lachnospiraceae bacterium]|nr:NAD-dependent DNA ligase LigA [Lachnospiraceae bacterium]